jgi:hypothetical protein
MNLGKTALSVLGTIAPTVLTAVGGPFGALAATVLHGVLGTGGDDKAADATLAAASPDTLAKVKQAEIELKQHMADIGIQDEQLQFADIANARAREIAVRDWTPRVLAWGVVLATFGMEGALLLGAHYPTQVAGEVLGRILGTLDSATLLVLSYYFGSSAASRTKDETISSLAKQ